MSNVISIYGGRDTRELPYYSQTDAADILSVPRSTLRAWCGNKTYQLVDGERRLMKPVFQSDPKTKRLTFNNLIEAYVLSSLTRTFLIPLPDLRAALDRLSTDRPLLDHVFYACPGQIFIEAADKILIDIHRSPGQVAIGEVVRSTIERIEFDASKRPERLHPWRASVTERAVVSVDPSRAFGQPTVIGRGLKVDVIVNLKRGGESEEDIARNYDLDVALVLDVLKWGERGAARAA